MFAEESEEELARVMSDEEDDSFDDDEDPDKIEVPGGGSTLEDALKIAPTVKSEPVSASSTSGSQLLSSTFPTRGLPPSSKAFKHESPHMHTSRSPYNNIPSNNNMRHTLPLASVNPSLVQQQFNNMLFDPMFLTRSLIQSVTGAGSSSLNEMLKMMPADTPQGIAAQNSFAQLYSALLSSSMGPMPNLGPPPPRRDIYPMGGQGQLSRGPTTANMWGQKPMNIHMSSAPTGVEEEDSQEDEVLGVAETYSDYVPAKLRIGKPHPDPIVETASLASVQPPEVYYKLKLEGKDKLIKNGWLSALQLEAIVYACQQHEFFLESGARAGYLVGDGAGVGKGRTIAGIIYENHLCGRKKALWVSVSADLKEDAERDLSDIGASFIKVTALNKLKYGKINRSDLKEGVLFSTYSGLIGESNSGGKFNTRFKQIVDWLGPDFDGLIVFDECHRAKNLCPVGSSKPTKTGLKVQLIQNELKKARVVYASATGASEPKNMAYMTRLGIWGPGTPFREFSDFINAVEKRGIGAMEIVAMDMKLRGAYIARQLSFKGVAFTIEEVPLTESFTKMYDASVELWVEALQKFIEAAELMKADNVIRKGMWAQFWSSHQRFFKYLCIAAKVQRAIDIAAEAVKVGKCVVIGLQSTGEARTAEQKEREGELDDFVSTAKGVFQSLVEKHFPAPDRNKIRRVLGISIDTHTSHLNADLQPGTSSSRGKPVRRAAQNAPKRGRWNDSDASDNEDQDSDFSNANATDTDTDVTSDSKASESDFESVSSEVDSEDGLGPRKRGRKPKPKAPPKKKLKTKDNGRKDMPSKAAVDKACEMREELLQKIEKLGDSLPNNTLDQLIDELGGTSNVAEMTGRKMRLVQLENGKIEYQSRAESDIALDQINLKEKQRFMDGDKDIAIISEAASSGISLQSDRRAKNKLRRVHITLELPWSADRAIQQFGRTHRSNQVNAPEYVFLISDLAGEHRFASIVAKRLESLGALTHGDRRATETRDLSRFHIDNRYGKMALESVMRYIMNGSGSLPAPPPANFPGEFRSAVASGLVGVGLIVNSEDNPGTPLPDKDYHNMSKFLNRILGMPVALQNALFKFFTDTLAAIIANAKKQGRYDLGILNLGDSNNGKTSLVNTEKFERKHATGSGYIELHKVFQERGMSWEESQNKFTQLTDDNEGYYLAKEAKQNKTVAVLVVGGERTTTAKKDKKSDKDKFYSIYRPSTGLQLRQETLREITSKYTKASPEKTQANWEAQFESSATNCIHAFWSGKCKNAAAGLACDIGRRRRTHYILSGSVLLCWDDVESAFSERGSSSKIQIVRVQFEDGTKFVGLLIPFECVESLKQRLLKSGKEILEAEAEMEAIKSEKNMIDLASDDEMDEET